MTTYAIPEDIAGVWQPLTPDEVTKAENLIDQATTKLRLMAQRRGLDLDVIALDPDRRDAIKIAIVNAVKRVLQNPKGLRQRSETTGPFSESETIDTSLSTGALYLDGADLIDIFPSGRRRIRSFTVRTGMLC